MEPQRITKTAQGDLQRTAPLFAKPVLSSRAPVHTFLQLQRTLGNQAVGRFLQAKLKVNQPGDVYEQEADRVTEQVMRMLEPLPAPSSSDGANPHVQRKCAACSSGGSLCPTCADEGALQAKETSDVTPVVSPTVENHISAMRGGGQPLPLPVRAFFEPRFGYDFSQVWVHTDGQAAASARAVNALAYTVGPNVVFGEGQYAPETTAGKKLLAHELAHVCQNGGPDIQPMIHRYEAPEHQDLGDEYLRNLLTFLQTGEGQRWAQSLGFNRDTLVSQIQADPIFRGGRIRLRSEVNPQTGRLEHVELTPGEIIALMGDLYGTWEELAAAPVQEIKELLQVMAQERTHTLSATEATVRYQEITRGQYFRLAESNVTHFARENKQEWRRLHTRALNEAQTAGQEQSEVRFQKALLIDAAAGHFLTDAFAAGHLFDRGQVMARINLYLSAHPPLAANPEMQGYLAIVDVAGKLPQLVLKNIHDRLNQEGFWATNGQGVRWRTFGDNYLGLAQETQRIAALAVFLSRQQLHSARSGQSPDPAEVEALLPDDDTVTRATDQAIAYIPDAVSRVENLMYRNRGLAPHQFGSILGTIVESNLSTVGSPARERQIFEMIESARRIGAGPVVAPSFTLVEFE